MNLLAAKETLLVTKHPENLSSPPMPSLNPEIGHLHAQ